jgi:hypothetical protein
LWLWFGTRGFAALLIMRVQDVILRSALLRASRRREAIRNGRADETLPVIEESG